MTPSEGYGYGGISLIPTPNAPGATGRERYSGAFSSGEGAGGFPMLRGEPGVWAQMRGRGLKANTLFDYLRSTVIGQEEAVQPICLHVWSAEAGIHDHGRRPSGVFLCFGPTGVGKTETAKRTASYLFDGEPCILPLNEFGKENSSADFKAALAFKVRHTEHCGRILLLDEIEKGSRDTVDALLSVLDEGRMLLPDGSYLDLSQFYIFLTSNIGSDRLYNMSAEKSGVESMRQFVFGQARSILRPEFFGRADAQVFFLPLTDDVQRRILAEMVRDKLSRVAGLIGGGEIAVSPDALDALVGMGFHDQKEGARKVRGIVNTMVNLAVNRACAGPSFPQPPLELRAFTLAGQAKSLEFASVRARPGALPGAALPTFHPGTTAR